MAGPVLRGGGGSNNSAMTTASMEPISSLNVCDTAEQKGQAVANKRADREASEGVVLAKSSADGKQGFMIVLNCETDFVAKNEDFIKFAEGILDVAAEKQPTDLDALKTLDMGGKSVGDAVTEQIGVIALYHGAEFEYDDGHVDALTRIAGEVARVLPSPVPWSSSGPEAGQESPSIT